MATSTPAIDAEMRTDLHCMPSKVTCWGKQYKNVNKEEQLAVVGESDLEHIVIDCIQNQYPSPLTVTAA